LDVLLFSTQSIRMLPSVYATLYYLLIVELLLQPYLAPHREHRRLNYILDA